MIAHVRMFIWSPISKCSKVRMFAIIRIFGCSMFECSLMFDCSKVRMFGCSLIFECSHVRMFGCSLIFFSKPCSRVRMFAEHERTIEHWTQMFNVRWPLLKRIKIVQYPLGSLRLATVFRWHNRAYKVYFQYLGIFILSTYFVHVVDNSQSGQRYKNSSCTTHSCDIYPL